jgi:hypothetical protein
MFVRLNNRHYKKTKKQNCIHYQLLTVVIFIFDNWFNQHNGIGTSWIINCIFLIHSVTSRKVAFSIPDGVIGIFHWHKPSGRTMALGLTQSLTEMSTRNISGGKGGRCVGLTTVPPSCAECLEIWEPQLPGNLRACPDLKWDAFTYTFTLYF